MFRVECPAELKLPLPAVVLPAPGALVQGNADGMAYLAAKQGREDLLAGRLVDAATQCPVEGTTAP